MAETKLEKLARSLNDEYREKLKAAVKEKYGIEITTSMAGFFSDNPRLVSHRDDGKDFTREQADYVLAFEAGYVAAMNQVTVAINNDFNQRAQRKG